MALIPIYLGSFRSVETQKAQKENHEKTGERPETMTRKDAMMFPIIASCALFGLYIFFHIFSKEYINLLLSFYFLVLGIFALSHMMSPVILKLIPSAVPIIPFHLKFTQGEGDSKETVVDYQFSTHDLVCHGHSCKKFRSTYQTSVSTGSLGEWTELFKLCHVGLGRYCDTWHLHCFASQI